MPTTRHRYPSSSSSSSSPSSSSTSIFSIPRTPVYTLTDSPPSTFFISRFNDFVEQINSKFNDIFTILEHIGNRLANLEESINDQRSIINELERELSIIADRLKKVSSSSPKQPHNMPSSSGNTKSHKSLTSTHTYSYTSFPRIESPRNSNPQSLTTPPPSIPPRATHSHRSFPPPKPAFSADYVAPSRSVTYWRSVPSSRTLPSRSENPSSSSGLNSNSSPRRNSSILVMGDSNTKYIQLPQKFDRIPTYTIEDIDPNKCIGYAKVWLHVGINSLKSIRCGGPADVRKSFELFMNKIDRIGKLTPNTILIVSPILPTGIKALNNRARAFNRLLFSVKGWWLNLNFTIFANRDNALDYHYRCFNNPGDKIHLGRNGILELQRMITRRISLVDSRSYSAVTKSRPL